MRNFGSGRRGKPADKLTRINSLGSTDFWPEWSPCGPSLGVIYLACLQQQMSGQQRLNGICGLPISHQTSYDAAADFGVNYICLDKIRRCMYLPMVG
jgi:hypothetical protein